MRRFGSVILLAGGKSRRMLTDKQAIRVDDVPLAVARARVLRQYFDDVVVSTDKPELYAGLDVKTVSDNVPGKGPMAGIESGLRVAASTFVYVTGCDMPLTDTAYIEGLQAELVRRILSEGTLPEGMATLRADDRIEPLNAFYRRDLADPMADCLQGGDTSLNRFCRSRRFLYLPEEQARRYTPDLRVFRNTNTPEDLFAAHAPAPPADTIPHLKHAAVLRITRDGSALLNDPVIAEARLELRVRRAGQEDSDDARSAVFSVLAERFDDFAAGWLLTEGIIGSMADIVSLETICTDETENRWLTQVTVAAGAVFPASALPAQSINEQILPVENTDKTPDGMRQMPVSPDRLFELFDALDRGGSLFHETGGTHVLALCDNTGHIVDLAQDVSRHAALLKLIGKALKENRAGAALFLIASCRLTASIVLKAVAAGIPLLASRAAVTTQAIRLARQHNIRLIGFVRDGRFNLYN